MSYYLDRVRWDGGLPVARVTLAHPPLNILDRRMLEALSLCLDELEACPGLRCVILTGEGRAFVAGGDLTEYEGITPDAFRTLLTFAHEVFGRLERLPVPVIAAINGFAIGGGMELALACDIRLCAESARIAFPEASIGLMPSYGGTGRLGALLGHAEAKYLIFSGKRVTADEALRLGLVQEVCREGELLSAAEALAAQIAEKSPVALRTVKRAMRESIGLSLEASLALERRCAVEVAEAGDVAEGILAFSEKRPPRFSDG